MFRSLTPSMEHDREAWIALQNRYYHKHWRLWMRLMSRDGKSFSVKDRRFSAPEWTDRAYFFFLSKATLLNSEGRSEMVELLALDAVHRTTSEIYVLARAS